MSFCLQLHNNQMASNDFTSLPGDGTWVHVQAGKASDLLFSQSGGVGLFYAQFLKNR